MADAPPGFSFFLSAMFLVVIELSSIAREVKLETVVKQGHRPLLLSSLVAIPFSIIRLIFDIVFNFVEKQINLAVDMLNRPNKIFNLLLEIQIKLLEKVVEMGSSEEDIREQKILIEQLEDTNNTIVEQYEKRLEATEKQLSENIQNHRNRLFNKVGELEQWVIPPLGRFALLHFSSYGILTYMFILSVEMLSGEFRLIAISIVLFLWVFLPALEVNEYDKLLDKGKTAVSIQKNIVLTGLLAATINISSSRGLSRPLIDDFHLTLFGNVVEYDAFHYSHLIIIVFILASTSYLRTLYGEIANLHDIENKRQTNIDDF